MDRVSATAAYLVFVGVVLIAAPLAVIAWLRPRYRRKGKPMTTHLSTGEACVLVGAASVSTAAVTLLRLPTGAAYACSIFATAAAISWWRVRAANRRAPRL
jgi:cobalamin synthase